MLNPQEDEYMIDTAVGFFWLPGAYNISRLEADFRR